MAVFPSNATIVFQLPANPTIDDDHPINEEGSPEIETTDFIMIASLGEQSLTEFGVAPVMDRDMDIHQKRMKGRCNFPPQMPNVIKPGATGDMVQWRVSSGFSLPESFEDIDVYRAFIRDNIDNVLQRGVFTLMVDTGSKFAIQEILGDKLRGYFTSDVSWSEVV